MISIINKIKKFFHCSKYTYNREGAEIIRRFILNSCNDPYEWDDFESIEEENQEVRLAIHLCWYFANQYPSDNESEYCNKKADVNFLKIADALDSNKLGNVNLEKAFVSLKKNILTDELKLLLEENYECLSSIADKNITIASLTNGTDYIKFVFVKEPDIDFDECNVVKIQLKIGSLYYAYNEEFLTESICDFCAKYSSSPFTSISLCATGFVLFIEKQDCFGHYQINVKIDKVANEIMIDTAFNDVTILDIERFVNDIKPLSISQPLSINNEVTIKELKHSRLGIASFITSIASLILIVLLIVVSVMFDVKSTAADIIILFLNIFLLSSILAFGFGVGGLMQKEKKKLFAILGIVFSAMMIVGFIVAIPEIKTLAIR